MPSAPPAVSVVIPTYNHANFLQAALRSVQAQTTVDWEAIVVNNFSQDNTIDLVAAFDDPRIRLVNFRNNGIIAASRNHGVQLAKAGLIAFLDSDDVWYPRKLELCLARLAEGHDLVCHGEAWVSSSAGPRQVIYGPAARAAYESLLFEGNCLSTSAVVVRKKALESVGGFNESPAIVTAEDYDLWLALSQAGFRFAFIPEILGEYRLHEHNQSKAALRNMNAILAVVERHYSVMKRPGAFHNIRMRRCRGTIYYGAARALCKNGEHAESFVYLWKAFVMCPFISRIYAGAVLSLVDWIRASALRAVN